MALSYRGKGTVQGFPSSATASRSAPLRELAIDRLTQFEYRILAILAAISANGAFIGLFFSKKKHLSQAASLLSEKLQGDYRGRRLSTDWDSALTSR